MIRPFYSIILDWDKVLTTNTFGIWEDKNNKCIIIIAINIHNMDINNHNVQLVIKWDILLIFNSMIEKIERADKKDGNSTFVFFTAK